MDYHPTLRRFPIRDQLPNPARDFLIANSTSNFREIGGITLITPPISPPPDNPHHQINQNAFGRIQFFAVLVKTICLNPHHPESP